MILCAQQTFDKVYLDREHLDAGVKAEVRKELKGADDEHDK